MKDRLAYDGTNPMPLIARRCAAGFLYILILFVAVPIVQSFMPLVPVRALDEHRLREPPPNFSLLRNSDGSKFAGDLNRWADDRIGLRDMFIRWKNQIDYSFFKTSRKVYIGADGWLFDRDNANARANLERLSDKGLANLEQSFVDLAEYLRRRHIELVVIGYPDKSIFYSNYMPNNAPRFPKVGRLGQLWEFLRHRNEFAFIDAAELLDARRAEGLLYYKTDIHPTVLGSMPIVREIVRTIAAKELRSDVVWNENFELKSAAWSGGVENLRLATLNPRPEQITTAGGLYEVGKDNDLGHWITDPRRVSLPGGATSPIFDWEFVSRPGTCGSKLPAAALFGDSFSDLYWALGLQNYFCSLRRARTTIKRLPPYLSDLPEDTRYFIFEFTT
ncbi:MAG TPA: hypothetical protein VG271_01590, partial [Beijerinckiaceae bacterium]|nr:hypothetical protein [Beijerinckiaceae bacterium]